MAIGQLNPTQLSSRLAAMSDQQLQQYASLHHDDPFVLSVAMDVMNQRNATRQAASTPPQMQQPTVVQQLIARMSQLPPMQGGGGQQMPPQQLAMPQQPQGAPQQPQTAADGGLMSGIAKLPASNLKKMKGGGITGYADRGLVENDPKQAFAMQYRDLASRVGSELGVDPGLIMAQWALETDWGRKTVGQYNFGNIKDPTGKGPKATDKAEGTRDSYRTYNTPEEFAADYVQQMKRNWPGALGVGSDSAKFAEGLRKGRLGPYATDKDYTSKLASTFSSLLPSAQAAPAAPPTPAGQIPGAAPGFGQAPSPAAPSVQSAADRELYTLGGLPVEHLFKGVPETAATLASGLFAPAVGAIKTGIDYARTGRSEGLEKNVGESVYVPRSEAGRRQVKGIAQVAEALKLPPYIPIVGGTMSAARAAQTAKTAQAAEQAAAQAAASAAKVAAPRVTPPAAAGTTPAREAALQRARLAELQRDQAAAQAAQATAGSTAQDAAAARIGAERAAANAAYNAGAAQRAGIAGLAGASAQSAAAAAPTAAVSTEAQAPRPISEAERAKMAEANAAPSTGDAAKAVAVAEKALPPERRKGMDWEDLMMFGFALMAGQSPYALQNVGAAGIAALKGKREREQAEREDLYRAALSKQAESLAAKYGAEVDVLKAGNSKMQKVVEYADKMFDNFLNTTKTTLGDRFSLTSEQANAKRLEYLHEAAKLYGLDPALLPSAVSGAATTNFKFNAQTGKIEPSR